MPLTGHAEIFPFEALTSSSTKEANFGTKAETVDGRIYRYCSAGSSALVNGTMQAASAPVANHVNESVQAAAAIGVTKVSLTLGATLATIDQYAEGYLVINDAAGEGHSYLIANHPAADSAATLVVTLLEPIKVALTTSSEYTLVKNPYDSVVQAPTTEVSGPVGVSPFDIPANEFGWLQTHGVASVLIEGTPAAGLSVSRSDNTAGAVEIGDGILSRVGRMEATGVAGEHNPVFLEID